MHGHLVTVEVRVEGGADQRMNLDRLALDEHWLKCLDAEPVECRSAIEKHGVVLDHLLKDIPHHIILFLDLLFRLFYGRGMAFGLEAVVDERLEQFKRHLLWQTALVELQLRADDDDRTTRIIDAFAEQILTEASLFALERIRERLERAIVDAAQHSPTTTVVEQSVDSLLEHPLFVADDDLGRFQLDQFRETVVAVNDSTIKVVEIRCREATAIQRDQWSKFRRNDRNHVQNHPLGFIP